MKTRKTKKDEGRKTTRGQHPARPRRAPAAPRIRRQLEQVLSGIAEGITVQRPDGSLIYANEAAARLIGYGSPEELIQTPVGQLMSRFDIADERGRPFPLDRLPGRIALQEGRPSDAVVRFKVKATGEERWSIVSASPILDARGRPQMAVNSFRDVTEWRNAEEAAAEQREYLRVTISSIGDAVIATNRQGCVTFMNPVAQSLTGWREEEAKGQRFDEVFRIFNEHTLMLAEDPFSRVIREGVVVGLGNHTLLERKDGQRLPIDDSAAPIKDPAGSIVGVVVVFRDATERRRAEAVLGRLAAIVTSSDDAIIGKDLDSKITSWNEAAERLYGYTPEEAIGQSMSLLIPADRAGELTSIMERLRQGERVGQFETVRMTKEGRRIPVEVSVSPVKGEGGSIIGASTIAREISKRKVAELNQRFLLDANELLASSLDYQATLERVAQLAVPGFADWCVVHIVRGDGAVEQIALAHNDPAKVQLAYTLQTKYQPSPDTPSALRKVLETGKPELVPVVPDEVLVAAARNQEHLELLRAVGIKSYMIVPLVARGRSLGAMTFVSGESARRFTNQDLEFAAILASRAAMAIDNARLYSEAQAFNEELERRVIDRTIELVATNRELEEQIEERRREQVQLESSYGLLRELASRLQAVREEERARIARELHDELGQALTAFRYDLSSLANHMPKANANLRTQTKAMLDRIDATIQLVRRIATELRPGMLDDLGLAAAIEWQAQEFSQRTGIRLDIKLPEMEVNPDRERATAIFRVFQETLTNITRHSKATHVQVQLDTVDDSMRLQVRDNGVGFEQAKVQAKRSLGLLGMQERAEILGGRFQVESAVGKGTTVTMIVPL